MNPTKKYIITRADDAGSNETANRAIADAIRDGLVRNVSLMACCSSIEDAAQRLAGMEQVCFGVHLTMNAEWDDVRWGSVAPSELVPSLLDEQGHFYPTPERMQQAGAKLDEVFIEMDAQLQRLRELGFSIAYADEHMGFGRVFPEFPARFDSWCRERGLINHRLLWNRLPSVDEEGLDRVEQLIAQLEAASPGVYVVVGHPAYDTEEMRKLGHPGYEGEQVAISREWQRLMFMDSRILEYVNKHDIQAVRYDEAIRWI